MKKNVNYLKYLLIGIILIIFYKSFEYNVIGTLMHVGTPLIIGAILAYFLQPLVNFVNSIYSSKILFNHRKISYLMSVFTVFLLIIMVISITMTFLLPGVINSVINFTTNINDYVEALEKAIIDLTHNQGMADLAVEQLEYLVETIDIYTTNNLLNVANVAFATSSRIFSVVLGIILTPYFLIEKDKLKAIALRILKVFFNENQTDMIANYMYSSHILFGRFIYGKFIDSVIIGMIAMVIFVILNVPFYPLMAAIVFLTNMIPYFGPFIGGGPVVVITFMVQGPLQALFVAIAILVIQQFDGLILGPKILGDTVGVSPFWVIVSITVFGGLWGFVGMFLAVPLISIIQMLFRDLIKYKNEHPN